MQSTGSSTIDPVQSIQCTGAISVSGCLAGSHHRLARSEQNRAHTELNLCFGSVWLGFGSGSLRGRSVYAPGRSRDAPWMLLGCSEDAPRMLPGRSSYPPQNPKTLISHRVLIESFLVHLPIPSRHSLWLGLRRYLIVFDPLTFVLDQ